MLYRLLRPALFTIDPEQAHEFSLKWLEHRRPAPPAPPGACAIDVAGITFPNPIGLAAGYDKDARVPDALLGMGFGFVEVGSITPRPQAGNPKPRLFRLAADRAVINRMGFNNGGAEVAAERLARRTGAGILGVNLGANKDSPDWIADYSHMARVMAPFATYLAVNVSSPNTPGLRAMQDAGALGALLDAVLAARGADGPPVFLKVAPDLLPADIDDIARIALDRRLGALIVSNTTVSRPQLRSVQADETGGLSGAPLKALALERLRDFRRATGGALPLIGVGGIGNGVDAWQRIKAGASLVQLYSAMVYRGPGIARTMADDVERLMQREGFSTLAEAVGSEAA
ncbi:quinone-dependent dihydroorotate dehydrogenase [Croceibacterium ferulae]|uniref:quinone-dependent dihydroorotate dehydrogenase n=1 Tax=Croceibacterium ferulae TaxID=1854641 RepID=UPI000EB03F78|nr:quinone-dependent dihydroorotate dehydrogenase [Croceibacterium ferulae]